MREVTMKTRMASTGRGFLLRLSVSVGIVLVFVMVVRMFVDACAPPKMMALPPWLPLDGGHI
jgi:hypothetical protein